MTRYDVTDWQLTSQFQTDITMSTISNEQMTSQLHINKWRHDDENRNDVTTLNWQMTSQQWKQTNNVRHNNENRNDWKRTNAVILKKPDKWRQQSQRDKWRHNFQPTRHHMGACHLPLTRVEQLSWPIRASHHLRALQSPSNTTLVLRTQVCTRRDVSSGAEQDAGRHDPERK